MQNTTLCYIEKNDSYLLLHRTKRENDLNKDKWIGIGGHCEEGESPEDCVMREVKEETGLTLTSCNYRGIITFVSDTYEGEYMHLFHAGSFTGTEGICDEGDLVWVRIDEMNNLPHWKGDEIFLALLRQQVPFFSLKLVYKGMCLQQAVLNGKSLAVE